MYFPKNDYARRMSLLSLLVIAVICVAGCSSAKEAAAPSQPAAAADNSASALLTEAQAAAQTMKKYGFELHMTQKVTGAGQADNADVNVNMLGRAERDPLKIDQTIKSDINGEASNLRTVIVPKAYYMYMPEFEEWSRLSKADAADNIKTLSDFQVNPEKALKAIQTLGSSLKDEKTGQAVTVRYNGAGAEAKPFMEGLLESSMGLSSFDKSVRDSLNVQKLTVEVKLDAEKHWPLSYRIDSNMTLEFEPGKKAGVHQTLSGTYTKHNVCAPVTVPKEAEAAIDPDEMQKELGSDPF